MPQISSPHLLDLSRVPRFYMGHRQRLQACLKTPDRKALVIGNGAA
jgi:hypothetical protein